MIIGELQPLAFKPQHIPPRHPKDDPFVERLNATLKQARPTLDEIKRTVCEFYMVSRDEFESHSRSRLFVLARATFFFFGYRYTRASLRMLGLRAGGVDHTTVRSAIRRMAERAYLHSDMREDLDLLRTRIAQCVLIRLHDDGAI